MIFLNFEEELLMKINIGVSTAARFWQPEKICNLAKKYDLGIELFVMRWHSVNWVRRILKEFPNLRLFGVHAPFYACNKQYWEIILARRTPCMDRLFKFLWLLLIGPIPRNPAIDIAQMFSCYINFHPNSFEPVSGCTVLIENPARDEGICSARETKALADEHGVETTFDTCHAGSCRENVIESFRIMDPEVVHLSDSRFNGDEHLLPGSGKLPLDELIQAIINRGKDTTIIIETRPSFQSEKTIEKSLKYLDKFGINY